MLRELVGIYIVFLYEAAIDKVVSELTSTHTENILEIFIVLKIMERYKGIL